MAGRKSNTVDMHIEAGSPEMSLGEQYLHNAEGQDDDFLAIKKAIIEGGCGPYASARKVFNNGLSSRSFATLLWHANSIVEDIYDALYEDTETLIGILRDGGEIHVPLGRIPSFRKACKKAGILISEDVRVTKV